MTTTASADATPVELPDSASGVLAFAREQRRLADRAEVRLLQAAVQWAIIHPAEALDDAESYTPRSHLWSGTEQPVALAGPGAPLVAEFAVAEFAAAVGMGTEAGKYYLGQAIELRYRLPRTWARVLAGELPAWKARRIAHETIGHALTAEAAGFVDGHVAPVAHRIGLAALQRLLEEAIARYMPEHAERRRREAADGRHFTIEADQVSLAGTSQVHGELDLADALDLEDAVRTIAGDLQHLGSEESLDVRRAAAVGELARRQLALDLASSDDDGAAPAGGDEPLPTPARPRKPVPKRPVRKTILYLHLHQSALQGTGGIGRVENTRSPVTADQIRAWCGHPATRLTIKPVIDLADHVHVEAYEVPDRIAEPVALRDLTCVFPHCTRPARRLKPDQHRADCDHVTPWRADDTGGTTCSCGIAPLCRHHHRHKTHTAWTYRILHPGSYLWTSPHGYQYLRDHHGTLDISPDRRR